MPAVPPTTLPPAAAPLPLPPPPPPDPSLVASPPTTIYSGGPIPGQQVPTATALPTATPVSAVAGPGQVAGMPAPGVVLIKLQQAYKERTGQDLTPEIRDRLLRGETIGAARPGATRVPAMTGPPRGYQTPRGRESAAQVGYLKAQTADVGAAREVDRQRLELERAREARAGAEFLTSQTGYVAGGGRLFARDLGIDTTGIYDAAGKLVSVDRFNAAGEQVAGALQAAGIDASEANITALLKGQSIQTPARMTLSGQKIIADITHDTARIQLAGREVTVGEKALEWKKIEDRAKLTGNFTDPETGLTTETLEKWNMQLQEGALKGIYQGDPTLQAKMQEWDQISREKATFGFDKTDAEGNPILGADGKPIHVYGTNELQLAVQQNDQSFQRALLAGFDYVDEDGETRHIKGQQELITDERQYTERVRTGYDEVVYEMQVDVNGNVVRDAEGNPVLRKDRNGNLVTVKDGQGRPVVRHIEGTQELSARLADRTAALQEQGMKLEDAQRTAQREWEIRRYTGFDQVRTINLRDLGLTGPGVAAERAIPPHVLSGGMDAVFRWMDERSPAYQRLEAALGHRPTADEWQQLIAGENVALTRAVTKTVQMPFGPQTVTTYEPIIDRIEGEAGLEVSRQNLQLTLQQNGFTQQDSDRLAEEVYQDKVRNGYWGVDAEGNKKWIYGTQEFASTETDKQRQWEEDQRVGYDKLVENKDGTTSSIHIEGTQEADQADSLRVDELTRDGWIEERARARVLWERQEKSRTGYFRETPRWDAAKQRMVTAQKWVPGDEAHERKLRQMADDLTREGWTQEDKLQAARIISAESMAQKDRLHNQWIQDRGWYYEQLNMNRADARQQAEQEWNTGEKALDRTLDTELAEMNLAASENRLEAEGRMALLQASIGALATMAGSGGLGEWVARLLGVDTSGGMRSLSFDPTDPRAWVAQGMTEGAAAEMVSYVKQQATITWVPDGKGGFIESAAGVGGGVGLGGVARVAAPIAIVYGGYRLRTSIKKENQGDRAEFPTPEKLRAMVGDLSQGLSAEDEAGLQSYVRAASQSDTGLVDTLAKWGLGPEQWDDLLHMPGWNAQSKMLIALLNAQKQGKISPAADTGFAAEVIRRLYDAGVLTTAPNGTPKSAEAITSEEDRMLREAWTKLPGKFRTARNVDDLSPEEVRQQVQAFAEGANILSADDAIKDFEKLGALREKDARNYTRSDKELINRLAVQLGKSYGVELVENGSISEGQGLVIELDNTNKGYYDRLQGLLDWKARAGSNLRTTLIAGPGALRDDGTSLTDAQRAMANRYADNFHLVPLQAARFPGGGDMAQKKQDVEAGIRSGAYRVSYEPRVYREGGGKHYTVTSYATGDKIAEWWD